MPKYSLIIPVYHCRAYLKECVDKILIQKISDFELLLIDDGSTDGSGILCDMLSGLDKRIKVFHKENGGVASARNYGLDRACGDYILFIDGDDTISSDCLETIDRFVLDHDLLIFGIEFDYYRKKRIVRKETLSCRYFGTYSAEEVTKNFSEYYFDNQLSSACNKVFNRNVLERHQIRFRDGMTLYEDFDFVVRVLQYTKTVFCVNCCIYYYRIDMDKPHVQRFRDWKRVKKDASLLNKSFENLYSQYPEEDILNVAANHYLLILQQYLMHMKPCKATALADQLPDFCDETSFCSFLVSGGRLKKEANNLLALVKNGDFSIIAANYRRKRIKTATKQYVKRILGR